MKNALIGAAMLTVLPFGAHAQSSWLTPGTSFAGFYVGAEGGLNWLLNNNGYNMNTGWAAGGVLGYDFVGPRVELEGVYRSNNGTRPGVVGVASSSATCAPGIQGLPVCTQIPGTTAKKASWLIWPLMLPKTSHSLIKAKAAAVDIEPTL